MDYCIYGLFDQNGLRYVGKTKTCEIKNRYRCHLKEQTKCHRVSWIQNLKKQNQKPSIHILIANLSEKEALEKEVLFIRVLRGFGIKLTNQTDGGDGVSGYKHTQETKRKMSQTRMGHKTSKQTREKISKALKGRIVTGMHGKHHSDESKKRISKSNLKTRGKAVLQLGLDGSTIKLFEGIQEAARQTNSAATSITACCRGKRKTHNGYRWRYA